MAFSRSYSQNLPSSFSTAHPSALEYSSRLPVSVCGTGPNGHSLEGFLGSMLKITINVPKGLLYYRASPKLADLPTSPIANRFNGLFRKTADRSLLRHHIGTIGGTGILTGFPSASPFGLS